MRSIDHEKIILYFKIISKKCNGNNEINISMYFSIIIAGAKFAILTYNRYVF